MHLEISNPMDYKVAIYIRLSKEDDNERAESESVTNQRSLLLDLVEKHRLVVYDIYIDDGYSGTTFDRPAFNRMIEDIEKKRVNMVITKDLSRLGRDYIQTGYYMERYFPENRVRYISLLDGIDTGVESTANEITPFRAIMNDMYAKDISKKIKSVKHDKQRKGLFIGGKAAYGYKLSETEKNKIVIDEEAAEIVRRIFAQAAGGTSCRQIAVQLNTDKVLPPLAYAGLLQSHRGPYTGLWSSERISAILQNEMYIGNMVQGKSKKISYKSGKCLHVDKKDWVVVENTHEPLVERDVFDKVQLQIESRKKTRERTYDYPLKGIICCHECGYPLAVVNRPNAKGEETLYFICRTYQRFTRARKCTCHSVKVDSVVQAVFEKVDDLCTRYVSEQALVDVARQVIEKNGKAADAVTAVAHLNGQIAALSTNLDRIYMDKIAGLLTEADFTRIYTRVKEERSTLEKKKQCIEMEYRRKPEENIMRAKAFVKCFLESTHSNRELLVSLIEKVELTEDKQVYIHFRFHQLEP